jgi:uncharacterized membrane protein YkvA (DUF1232 family)
MSGKQQEPLDQLNFKQAADLANDAKALSALLGKTLRYFEKNKGSLGAIASDLGTLVALLQAWSSGRFHNISGRTIVLAVAALIYFVNPLDVVSDFLPVIGWMDDIVVLSWMLKSAKKDLDAYRGVSRIVNSEESSTAT